ncbi:MAG: hypothetical protein PHV81_03000 [Candidatus Methanomethylophilaceae archaeon]|jgi:hypothetical protein|nr:hypothetical protein [Candidatus Methanomethylophilaceae archaeon]NCA74153.1 hypothetical protein [Gammaproteobacteria bacterium]MDD2936551.1 hypothetical protein [Candidatus Methanomethylophilaceae archaeon]MDD3351606.1 hypothetical protein [Candidatus Methanomethylophilaceae archaeon]MDD3986806.1 hypothetical protein [Candidatus Methanomethylophilaceae archaeon]
MTDMYSGAKKKGNRKNGAAGSEIEGDVLSIDCRDCGKIPDPGSAECIRCIVSRISENGCAVRIRLRTGRDTEISGPAAEVLCELSFIDRSASSVGVRKMRRCGSCRYSCDRVVGIAWGAFPSPDFAGARGKLMSFRPSNSVCEVCVQKTYRALDQAELSISEVSKRVSAMADGKGA